MIEIQSHLRENPVDQPAEEKEQKQNQGGRSVGKRFVNSKKIGKIVDEGKRENKKQKAPAQLESREDENQKENGYQGHLKWFYNRHITDIKKIKADPVKES
ncbi:MAG: hypothetical protein QHH14_14925 [Clostridiales bacterium]|nr:hypothetical protein [Clostridiales bacterium]